MFLISVENSRSENARKRRKTTHDMEITIAYLQEKGQREAQLRKEAQEREVELRREELQLKREQLDLDRARLEMEREERNRMWEMLLKK